MRAQARAVEVSIIDSLRRTNDVYTPLAHYPVIQVSLAANRELYYTAKSCVTERSDGVLLTGFFVFNAWLRAKCTRSVFNEFQLLGNPLTSDELCLKRISHPSTCSAKNRAFDDNSGNRLCPLAFRLETDAPGTIARNCRDITALVIDLLGKLSIAWLRGESIIIIFCHLMEIERAVFASRLLIERVRMVA